ncbi:MAG TPA: hypothetical protein PKW15_04530 [Alphaproteobacteria bacterium]|nr:hypothetical protein [Rhodospirillaceae bacterium]HRJ12491.1 hypothetical protein [Alphaproteobacteria bacterium]
MSGDSVAVLERKVTPSNRISANATRFNDRDIIPVEPADAAPALPKLNLTFGDDVPGSGNRVSLRSPYATHRMQIMQFGFAKDLEEFVRDYAQLILTPGLDGKPFAPVMAVVTKPGEEVYAKGLAVNCGYSGFLQSLLAVVEDCRMKQFPWLEEVLPQKTYQQLSCLQIPRRPAPRGPAVYAIE